MQVAQVIERKRAQDKIKRMIRKRNRIDPSTRQEDGRIGKFTFRDLEHRWSKIDPREETRLEFPQQFKVSARATSGIEDTLVAEMHFLKQRINSSLLGMQQGIPLTIVVRCCPEFISI